MNNKKDAFDKLARKAYLSYHQDGLIDIIIGACFLGFAFNMLTDSAAFTILGWMPIIFYLPLKRAITYPRLGYVSFEGRQTRQKLLIMSGVGILVLGLFVMIIFVLGPSGVSPSTRQFLSRYLILFFGVLGAFFFGLTALLSGIRRFFYYAIAIIVIFGTAQLLRTPEYTQIIIFGTLLLISGASQMVKFIQKYPITRE